MRTFRPVCFLWQRHDPVEAQGHRAGGSVRQGRDLTTSREHYGPIFQLRCLWFLSPWTKWTRVVKHGKGISEETTTSVLELKMVAKSELSLPTINVDNVQTQRLSAATSISYRPATIPGVCLGISIFFFAHSLCGMFGHIANKPRNEFGSRKIVFQPVILTPGLRCTMSV